MSGVENRFVVAQEPGKCLGVNRVLLRSPDEKRRFQPTMRNTYTDETWELDCILKDPDRGTCGAPRLMGIDADPLCTVLFARNAKEAVLPDKISCDTRIGRVVLKPDLHEVSIDESDTAHLTGHETRLLRTFMLNPRKVLTRTELHMAMYPESTTYMSSDIRVVTVNINRLRDKLGAIHPQGRLLIGTVRQQGYVLLAKDPKKEV